jgi:sigma-E factor negative regulatory protein RseB
MAMNSGSYRAALGALAALLLAVGHAAVAGQADEAQRWLERMTQAVKNLNYKGTFVYSNEGRLESMRLIHRAEDGVEQERLYSLTGAAREIIRDNDKVTRILPRDRAIRIDWTQSSNPFADVLPSDLAPLRAHYRFELQGQGRVAERHARIVAILPLDEYRYGYRLWIDQENGLLLRSDLLSETGDVVEQLLFTRLEVFDSIPEEWLRPTISGDGYVQYQSERGRAVEDQGENEVQQWPSVELPPGFAVRAKRLYRRSGAEAPVEHLLISDGLANVSIYIESTKPEQAFSGGSRVGAVNAFGRWEQGVQFTVVGEVPAHTVAGIARSLQPSSGE